MSSSPPDRRQPVEPVPEQVARVAELMSAFRADWFLCGGWAVDAWLGRQTRDHHDIEIAAFQEDQPAIFERIAGWQPIGHDDNVADDTKEPWDGRRLDMPAHVHARPGDAFEFEVQFNERAGGDWIFNREPLITLPVSACTYASRWGLPAVSPEVMIFYKAHQPVWRDERRKPPRPHDELDFVALLPHLSDAARSWLREAIGLVSPAHPWLARL